MSERLSVHLFEVRMLEDGRMRLNDLVDLHHFIVVVTVEELLQLG